MNTEFQFELTTPITYHSGGEEVEGSFITLYAPSKKQMKNNIVLKEAFFKAVDNQESNPSPGKQISEQEKLSGVDLIDLLYISGISMHPVLLSAIELFKSGVAKIEGSASVTQPILDALSQDDLEAMTGEYMINFTLASFLKRRDI